MNDAILEKQRELCRRYTAAHIPCEDHSTLGISEGVRSGNLPINGLRHPPEKNTSGWYIWTEPYLSQHPDFFQPLHVEHLFKMHPEIIKFLGLAPGWRFLIAKDYEDVWYDASLLDV